MDLLLKRLDEHATKKRAMYGTIKAMDSHMMCEVCGGIGHLGNDCLETRGATAYINNGFSQQGGQNGWNHQSRPQHRRGNSNFNSIYNWNEPSLKDLVLSQVKTIEPLKEKLKINDKMFELMNFKIEGLTSSMNNQ
jgi:hypothetical protein